MKRLSYTFILSILCVFLASNIATAQEDKTTTYFVVGYMKVKPGMGQDYEKMEAAWKKIHEAKIKEGGLDGWTLLEILSPSGENTEYNYLTINRLSGDKMLAGFYEDAYFPENWKSLLTEEELALVDKTGELRDIVKTEVWSYVDGVFPDDWTTSKIQVCNYFKNNPGKSDADHEKVEVDIWKPIHAARVNDGTMEGWGLYNMELPFGSSMPYSSATVDFYSNMEQYLTQSLTGYFEKVHAGKDMDELWQQTSDAAELLHGEVRMVINQTGN